MYHSTKQQTFSAIGPSYLMSQYNND